MHFLKNPDIQVAKFGFDQLDRYTGGIRQGQYTILFAATSEGKSTYARLLAGNMAFQGKKVLYISLEEDEMDSVILSMSLQARYNAIPIFDGNIDAQIAKRTHDTSKELQKAGGDVVFIDTVENRGSYEQLVALADEHSPDIIFLDQLTLFTPGGSSEEKDLTKVTRMCKRFCQDSKIPMVALTQRKQKTEKVADAYNIGYAASIAQDADVILYLHSTDHDGDYERKKLTIVKNRKRRRYVEIEYVWKLAQGIVREVEDYTTDITEVID